MEGDGGAGDVDADLATAVGLFALDDVTIAEAADAADVTVLEVENAIESAGLAEPLGLDRDVDVGAQIDSVLDGDS